CRAPRKRGQQSRRATASAGAGDSAARPPGHGATARMSRGRPPRPAPTRSAPRARPPLGRPTGHLPPVDQQIVARLTSGNFPTASSTTSDSENARDFRGIAHSAFHLAAKGNLADARSILGKPAEALQRQVQQEPTNRSALSQLGITEALLGNREEALRCARKAIELVPEAKEPWIGPRFRGDVCDGFGLDRRLGRSPAGIRAFVASAFSSDRAARIQRPRYAPPSDVRAAARRPAVRGAAQRSEEQRAVVLK
ncbi:MAG: hypothetical protein RLZZ15_552, partial [Verrucomicrobiota bacterium]